MQLKITLEQEFEEIMQEILETTSDVSYEVILPPFSDNGGHGDVKNIGIPMSSIVKNMKNEIYKYRSQKVRLANSKVDATVIGIFSLKIGRAILYAFQHLFDKYIASSSQLTINIKSATRNELTAMFDQTFFSLWLEKQLQNLKFRDSKSNSITSLATDVSQLPSMNEIGVWNRLKYGSLASRRRSRSRSQSRSQSRNQTNTIANPNANENQDDPFFIKIQFEQYYKQLKEKSNNRDINEGELLKWLLTKVIVAIEPAVSEVSLLMNDSYSRFQRNDQEMLEKAVELATSIKKT